MIFVVEESFCSDTIFIGQFTIHTQSGFTNPNNFDLSELLDPDFEFNGYLVIEIDKSDIHMNEISNRNLSIYWIEDLDSTERENAKMYRVLPLNFTEQLALNFKYLDYKRNDITTFFYYYNYYNRNTMRRDDSTFTYLSYMFPYSSSSYDMVKEIKNYRLWKKAEDDSKFYYIMKTGFTGGLFRFLVNDKKIMIPVSHLKYFYHEYDEVLKLSGFVKTDLILTPK